MSTQQQSDELDGSIIAALEIGAAFDFYPQCFLIRRKAIRLGRFPEWEICIPTRLIARHLASIVATNGIFVLDKSMSGNLCRINGQLVAKSVDIHDGDEINFYSPSDGDPVLTMKFIQFDRTQSQD